MTISNNKTSLLVSSQVPDFVRNDHEKFVKFLEAYYRFMEQEGGVLELSKNLTTYYDIDQADDVIRQKIYNDFIRFIPRSIISDPTLITKYAKDFYRARGSEKSLRFLLNILTPKLFVPSYQNVYVLKLKETSYNNAASNVTSTIQKYVGHTVTGANTYAYGTVDSAKSYYDNGQLINEIVVVSVQGQFEPGENIVTRYAISNTANDVLVSTLYTSGVESIRVNPLAIGSGYTVGTVVPLQSASGSGANAIISRVSTGNISNIIVVTAGAGFQTNNHFDFASNTGVNANAIIRSVDASGYYHPNSYTIYMATIGQESNTTISNTKYANLSATITDPANAWISNVASQTWIYSNVGPIQSVLITNTGSGYVTFPTIDVSANTRARSLGMLGRLEIANGGFNYSTNDKIDFINVIGGYGYGARANVTDVDANGTITRVEFESLDANTKIGGEGYDQDYLPIAVINTSTGNDANIIVTAIIADGETINVGKTTIGCIEGITVLQPGNNYDNPPTIDLTGFGDGLAEAFAILRPGVLQWPSRFVAGQGEYTAERDAEIYYPKTDVLRASAGKWYIEKTIRITNTQYDNTSNALYSTLDRFRSKEVRGVTSNATALIERVNRFFEGTTQVDELVISGIKGNFLNGEKIYTFHKDDYGTHYISSKVFEGALNTVTVTKAGASYNVGDIVTVTSADGYGANANVVVSKVSGGNISSITVTFGGAGFTSNDYLLISADTGSGGNAKVSLVNTDETYHPNSYQLMSSQIYLEANTALNAQFYSNLSMDVSEPATKWITNVASYYTLSNVGPVQSINVLNAGVGYKAPIKLDIQANSALREQGTLGRLEITDPGAFYLPNDKIYFTNSPGGFGYGARANVTSVDNVTGEILAVKFETIDGYEQPGGAGYTQSSLPTAEVDSTYGGGAVITVKAVLGDGEALTIANSTIGAIEQLTIVNRGDGYKQNPTLNLSSIGDGTAQASATIINGVYEYPGRYLNDDGHLSSANYLQNEDYYQDFSYVIQSKTPFDVYAKQLKDTVHPAGALVLGEYHLEDMAETQETGASVFDATITLREQTVGVLGNIYVTYAGAFYNVGDPVNIISNYGSNAVAVVSEVITGNVNNIEITFSGAGFQANDFLTLTGTDATARVYSVDTSNTVHQNRYTIYNTVISIEANTAINNTKYANANTSITDPANVWFKNVVTSFVYANTGPITAVQVLTSGNATSNNITVDVASNTIVRALGVMARLQIVSGGKGYVAGDPIVFTNIPGGYGYGANAYVSTVAANGMITGVAFGLTDGEYTGGAGYDINYLPLATVVSSNTLANGANVVVRSTLGDGEILAVSNTNIRGVSKITILNRGDGFIEAPIIDLTQSGDGKANAYATVITSISEIENIT